MLKPDRFSCSQKIRLKQDPPVISLIIQRNLVTKIRAKQESGLTTVRLKWDPPVYKEIWQKIRAMRESGLTAVWLKRDPPVI